MDTLKQPSTILSGINTVGLIGAFVYFYKKETALQDELNNAADELNKINGEIANLRKMDEQTFVKAANYATGENAKIVALIKKRTSNITEMKTIIEAIITEMDTIHETFENIQEALIQLNYKGSTILPRRSRRGKLNVASLKQKKVSFARPKKQDSDSETDDEDDEEDSEGESEEEETPRRKGKKKKAAQRRTGKKKPGKKKPEESETDPSENEDDVMRSIEAVRQSKR